VYLNIKKLSRVTSSGDYFPIIDGLRFISIFFVLICHLSNHFFEFSGIKNNYYENLFENGHNGVRIFFAISGYILMLNAIKKLNLKKYYLRRVIRIEPTYIISLIIIYFVIYHRNLLENLDHLIVSFFYLHSIIYDSSSIISPITWSLEVEVQFYLSFPFVYLLINYFDNKFNMGMPIILSIIIMGVIFNYYYTPIYRTLLDNITFFYTGVLIAYLFNKREIKKIKISPYIISICQFIIITLLLCVNSVNSNILYQTLYLFLIYSFFNLTINYESHINSFLGSKFISITGGMCYTIYLYHIVILLLFNKYFFNYTKNAPIKILLFYVLYLIAVWVICSILYFLFEKPFMKKLSINTIN
jgi:peptidoglycan/LPS O-acetylase OafA/YrhL